ncbi:hypothetical protein ACIBL3_33850 [Kribbella sp. NPDC050124]|uniref:hypothetical protein n=1 Tax=Kribbella sp. NPDC050124 TaxID=3364114 RepID=UPI0037A103DD
MSEFEREERAFRTALATHAIEAPPGAPEVLHPVRRRWLISLTAAAAVAVALLLAPLVISGHDNPSAPPSGSPTTGWAHREWRWVSYRNVEVKAPAAWNYDYGAARPDCINPRNPTDPWARDVPNAPYVMVGVPARVVPSIGCSRKPEPGDPDPAFGDLPFAWWQPYIKLDEARPDLDYPDRKDGQWQYRDWRLTRTTVDDVQISVLAPPDDPSLGGAVLSSVKHVEITSLGCETDSPAQGERFAAPSGSPIPAADEVAAVAICEYSRINSRATMNGRAGLDGSHRITGQAARNLVAAIHDAPTGGGPDRPENCVQDMYGDRAIALRFFATSEETNSPLAEAYVYYDWCFGNGIVGADGKRQLTRANCAPLFAQPPITLWSGSMPVVEACGPPGR